ncbi:MAG: hypothetical protein A2312_01630 [Candidatus Staskawiczbacteria bacterium RIFOXYB2_FULL_32_9]|uniref:HEPN domain-containing protein n=1 Tax=Candidatus Staskawiczbacteria bacterium RIFOXYD1_FULL_32_13 TaxID=1802234 RepID=A0A1G2JRG2_9BACT|nr:MAG: HEPN domain protein [Parcubacteria group bacterium GW2011_GWC2_32_10]OGZ79008.1 MAG: hypothetical protein A2360_03005 [Candidatus Staskawiczbacteria bacterium RIFOXYB1_FULL_32_11]OGZ80894.1 MAG: hypothetical protein A2256_03625 [Candidatus Staskawiczbacteria bacterium RIFOXYA2_FULL_32_7]OGZ82964.1 MAG: hypothetical protein A2312_01630 [Candidatus Staskawiczbacteria bacterium RIFOXYB2_FULL_32_9]OGZ88268.1 MAG: hypothetical protein A2463_01510 [Candidatus Staskawiczbacteria bacterium RIFO
MQNNKEIVLEWIKRADNDELNIVSILKHKDGEPSLTCFLSQQMAEKYLKALLIFYENNYPRIHSLIKLLTLISKYSPDILKEIEEEIILIEPYYIETRYSEDILAESFSWEMAEKAYESAKRIKNLVLEKLK